MRWLLKMNAARAPFFILGDHVFGEKNDRSSAADGLVRAGRHGSETDHGAAIGRPYHHESPIAHRAVEEEIEPQLVDVEANAAVHITNIDRDEKNPEVGDLRIQARDCAWPLSGRRVAHGRKL